MKINGYGIRDHLRICLPLMGIIAGVWLLRMIAHEAGVSFSNVQKISVTVALEICVALAVVRLYLRGMGGYSNVVTAVFILNLWAQMLIGAAVVAALFLHLDNIYVHPAFMIPPDSPDIRRHLYAQMTFVLGFYTLLTALTGCLLLFLLRRLLPDAAPRR